MGSEVRGREKVEVILFNASEKMEALNLWTKSLGKVGHLGEESLGLGVWMERPVARLQWDPSQFTTLYFRQLCLLFLREQLILL